MPGSIIIADDYEDNRELLRLILEMAGHRVREARDGRECVQMAQLDPPDLFLLDLSMPVLDGWSALRELRADERTRHIPCIAVTAFADTDRERALGVGFDAYLTKPFRGKELVATIEQLLATSQREESV
ncbi:MAG TPA: response regulator [Pyrinomonadaceae bacterium]